MYQVWLFLLIHVFQFAVRSPLLQHVKPATRQRHGNMAQAVLRQIFFPGVRCADNHHLKSTIQCGQPQWESVTDKKPRFIDDVENFHLSR